MITIFNIEKLKSLLRDFYEITQIRITVFDERLDELVSYPPQVAPYCRVIRGTAKGFDACINCDARACAVAAKRRDTYIYQCHAGLTEAIMPLYVGDIPVGYLLFGHVFSYEDREQGIRTVLEHCAPLKVEEQLLRKTLSDAVFHREDYVKSAAQILHAVASYLIMEQMATLQNEKLAVKLDSILSATFTENISADTLCAELGIGKTQLYKLSKELYGCGVAGRIRQLRMERARLLLKDPDKSIAQIAPLCGYGDYNYFITVFTRETGMPPNEWRKRNT